MKAIAAKVGYVWRECPIAHRVAAHQPACMRPPPAVAGRMRIARLVGILMMEAMGRDPKEGTALQCKGAADGQNSFHPPRGFVAAMGEQAVIPHAYAPTP